MTDVSVVVPVRDGERYLGELLDALTHPGDLEVLVIDSGSRDRSRDIARAAGVGLLEIPTIEFGHGRTRNLGVQRTSGELICFLTQDATPVDGWLDAYLEAFEFAPGVGAAFGPHIPRAGTSPMIARELTEFFAAFAPDGHPTVQRSGDNPFLSNVNACYARACWREIGFRDVAYSEDQAFGRDMLAAGWAKVFHPQAAVLHSHDYKAAEFMRRYFDEYRGLRETTGHVESFGLRSTVRDVRAEVARDRAWMRARGWDTGARAGWTARAVVHHTGRKAFAALGSRSERLPAGLRRTMSLEGRAGAATTGVPSTGLGPHATPQPKRKQESEYAAIAKLLRDGPSPLLDTVPGMADADRLHLAILIPPFSRGSGGHGTIFQIVSRLERKGHACSVWVYDPFELRQHEWPAVTRRAINEFFAPVAAPAYYGFEDWYGADVVVATGWETVYPAMLLDQSRARAYLVNDHEPDFFPNSVEAHWAEQTYRLGLYSIAASPWLRDVLINRYGASATDFQLGVDHDIYYPRAVKRREDTVIFYARSITPRRGVGLGALALEELWRRRPEVRIVLYGDQVPMETAFPYEHLGVASTEQLALAYSEATVGLSLSLTNFSLIPKEMLACGLPCVELAGISAESIFGSDGPLELAAFDPSSIADAIERLLDDRAMWERRSRQGIDFVASHNWDVATEQVEAGLRQALREREVARALA